MTRPAPKKVAHRSLDFRRRRFCAREEAFGALWEHENRPRPGTSFGYGILQDLMFYRRAMSFTAFPDNVRCRQIIRNRDAAIAATVVQWLGTNVGSCFLEESLHRCARQVVEIDPPDRSWINPSERLPKKRGRYVVRTLIGGNYVSPGNSQADFLVGVAPGTTGLWSDYTGRPIRVAWWWEPRELR